MLGYKINGKDYKGKYIPILNARKIMNNDDYKYIEIENWLNKKLSKRI